MIINTSVRDQATHASIWLLVQVNGQGKVFEFVPGNDRCVVIGSAGGADVRLDGVAPIALYLQRDGTRIRLIPAYAETGCRLNTVLIRAPCVIEGQGLIELMGYQIALYLSWANPATPGSVPAAPQSGTTTNASASIQTRLDAQAQGVLEGALDGSPRRMQAKTFVLGSRAPSNSAEPAPTRQAPNRIQPAPILPLGSDAERRPRPFGTQALSPSELAAILAMAPARQPLPPRKLDQPTSANSEPFAQTRHSASSIPVGAVPDAYAAAGSELPKVIPFEPMQAAASLAQRPNSSGHGGSPSTVVEVRAVSPAAIAAHPQQAEPDNGCGVAPLLGSNPSPDGQRLNPQVARQPRGAHSHGSDALPSNASSSELNQLGRLARRHRVGVISVGCLMLVVLVAGAARLLQPAALPRLAQKAASSAAPVESSTVASVDTSGAAAPNRVAAPRMTGVVAVATPSVATSSAKGPVVELAHDERASTGVPVPPATKRSAAESAPDLSVPNAAGHLFASRLAEAEQAYRELAAKNPNEPIFSTVVRLLAKRNSPDCRNPNNNTRKSCPTVKP